jgi:hypothetical protein
LRRIAPLDKITNRCKPLPPSKRNVKRVERIRDAARRSPAAQVRPPRSANRMPGPKGPRPRACCHEQPGAGSTLGANLATPTCTACLLTGCDEPGRTDSGLPCRRRSMRGGRPPAACRDTSPAVRRRAQSAR